MKTLTILKSGWRLGVALLLAAITLPARGMEGDEFGPFHYFGGLEFPFPPPPNPPVADAGATVRTVISPNGTNATITLDASRSAGHGMWFSRWQGPAGVALGDLLLGDVQSGGEWWPTLLGRGLVTSCLLPVGTNTVTLIVDQIVVYGDMTVGAYVWYQASRYDCVEIEVITAADALRRLASKAAENPAIRNKQPLLATLNAARAAFDRGNPIAGLNLISAFQNKVRAQIAPSDPALAEQLASAAQEIVTAVTGD
jgi:hypothetical protein